MKAAVSARGSRTPNTTASGQNQTLESEHSPRISVGSAEPEGSKRLILSTSAVPVTDVGQSTHPAAERYEEQAVAASPPTGTVAPPPAPNAPADLGTTKMPLVPRPAVAPVRVGSPIPQPNPVRIISVRRDGTLITSAIGSIDTSFAAVALKPPAPRV
jgi:hypothetical protein